MFTIKNAFIYLLAAAFALIAITSCSSDNESQNQSQTVSDSLPHDPYSAPLNPASRKAQAQDFTTTLLNGDSFTLSDQQGKVVLLNIWATWCPPCEEETPALNDLYEKYRDQGVEFLGISIDEQGRSVVKPFVEKYDVSYPITIDDGSIMEKYGPTMGVPTTYLLDKEGNLRYFATGAITKEELEPRLQKLINE